MNNYLHNLSMEPFFNFIQTHIEYLFPFSIFFKGFILFFIFSISLQLLISRHKNLNHRFRGLENTTHFILEVSKIPIFTFIGLYFIYLLLLIGNKYYPEVIKLKLLTSTGYVIEFITLFWFLQKSLNSGKIRLSQWLINSHHHILHILFKMISNSLLAIIYIALLNILIPEMGLMGLSAEFAQKGMHLILIGTIGWIFIQILNAAEQLIINRTMLSTSNILGNRKITTQVKILKRVFVSISIIVIIAAMLMVFDSVRAIGAGMLTTAGIIGAAGAFASQRSLAGLFSGLNIAFTQPIRIGDTVVIDNESGQVEEITLSYVVIKLWDLRRLILPTDYFTNKGVMNLTRNSTELVGTVLFYVDYTFQVDVLRKKFNEMLSHSILWDKKTSAFQVTALKEQSVEIRALVSAKNLSDLWNLRCEIREELLKFIVENFPTSLPRTRQISSNI